MSGRKRDSVWNYFNEINKQSVTNKKASCKKCGKTLQAMVVRMKAHKTKCVDATDSRHSSDEEDDIPLAEIARKGKPSEHSQKKNENCGNYIFLFLKQYHKIFIF